jgi:hypothetical protein
MPATNEHVGELERRLTRLERIRRGGGGGAPGPQARRAAARRDPQDPRGRGTGRPRPWHHRRAGHHGAQGPKGEPRTGATGAQGIQGPQGPQGVSGASTFMVGTGAPTAGVGIDGTVYPIRARAASTARRRRGMARRRDRAPRPARTHLRAAHVRLGGTWPRRSEPSRQDRPGRAQRRAASEADPRAAQHDDRREARHLCAVEARRSAQGADRQAAQARPGRRQGGPGGRTRDAHPSARGAYDPNLDVQERAAKRGYRYTTEDLITGI